MRKAAEILFLILEAVAYCFFGSVFVLVAILTEEFLASNQCSQGFSCGESGRNIPLCGVLIGSFFSYIFWKLIVGKIVKSKLAKWFLVLLTSSITAILIQSFYIISYSQLTTSQIFYEHRISESLGINLMIKLFVILSPFTILFANRDLLIDKFRHRNALK